MHVFYQLFSAPADVVLFVRSPSYIYISFTPNADDLGVEYYRALIVHPPGEHECTVPATNLKLRCGITFLDEKATYTVSGAAYRKDGRCSVGVEKNAMTYEMRMVIDVF